MAPISAADATVALRSFPRRWTSLLGGLDPSDPDVAALLARAGPEGISAGGAVAEAADALEEADHQVRAAVGTAPAPPPSPPGEDGTPRADDLVGSLRRLELAAPALADTVDDVAADDLDRRTEVAGRSVAVRALVSDVVGRVATLLRQADQALRTGRGSGEDGGDGGDDR